MAYRGSAARTSVGNPMAAVLRDLGRQSRSTAKRRVVAPEQGPEGPQGAPGAPGTRVLAARVYTAEDGAAGWEFPEPFAAPPVVTALVYSGGAPYVPVLADVTEQGATFRVWLGSSPAGVGVEVHVMAILETQGTSTSL